MTKYDKIQIDGVEYKTTFPESWANRKNWVAPDPHLVHAHLPGTIARFEVKEGQLVKEGDLLLILNAMKMENKILAPLSGRVKKIYLTKGSRIPKGELMLELEDVE